MDHAVRGLRSSFLHFIAGGPRLIHLFTIDIPGRCTLVDNLVVVHHQASDIRDLWHFVRWGPERIDLEAQRCVGTTPNWTVCAARQESHKWEQSPGHFGLPVQFRHFDGDSGAILLEMDSLPAQHCHRCAVRCHLEAQTGSFCREKHHVWQVQSHSIAADAIRREDCNPCRLFGS